MSVTSPEPSAEELEVKREGPVQNVLLTPLADDRSLNEEEPAGVSAPELPAALATLVRHSSPGLRQPSLELPAQLELPSPQQEFSHHSASDLRRKSQSAVVTDEFRKVSGTSIKSMRSSKQVTIVENTQYQPDISGKEVFKSSGQTLRSTHPSKEVVENREESAEAENMEVIPLAGSHTVEESGGGGSTATTDKPAGTAGTSAIKNKSGLGGWVRKTLGKTVQKNARKSTSKSPSRQKAQKSNK